MRPGFDACQFFVLCGDRCVVHGVNSSFAIFVLFVLFVALLFSGGKKIVDKKIGDKKIVRASWPTGKSCGQLRYLMIRSRST
jgi:hypothetical protein